MATRLASVPAADTYKVHARLDCVTRVYPPRAGHGEVHALGPLSMELRAGEFFSVVGPSGCGKSTLLDVLAGLAVPSAGTVEFEGKRVLGEVPDGVGVVFQEDASFPWLSVEDNVAFGLRRAGVDGAETRRRVDFAIGFMGLADFRRAYPSQLSGGMRQRVAIARTLILRPRIILMDEPFGALDPSTRLHMQELLNKLWREAEATVFFVTHSIEEAVYLGDRVYVFSSSPGTILREIAVPKSDRPPKEMQREKAFIELVADLRDTVDTLQSSTRAGD
jgi:NitT/TauT family transport system ATP-binding protein